MGHNSSNGRWLGVGRSAARDAQAAGFYMYGEIALTRGVSGFHNQTLVVLAVG